MQKGWLVVERSEPSDVSTQVELKENHRVTEGHREAVY